MEEGGREFHYIPCLNANTDWLDALYGVALQHMQGWPLTAPDAAGLQASRKAALGLGAGN
jgi:ferrochelatase